ncbi:hypothetical protein MRB53_036794 [Persea americana]|nr:hypothetical protein MRB53_036794 [Persea americana]
MTPFAKRRGPSIHPDREKWTQPVLRTSGYNPKDSLSLDSRHVLMSVYGTSTPGQTELGSSEEEAHSVPFKRALVLPLIFQARLDIVEEEQAQEAAAKPVEPSLAGRTKELRLYNSNQIRTQSPLISRVLVDNGAALNVMPITMLKVLGKTEELYQKMDVSNNRKIERKLRELAEASQEFPWFEQLVANPHDRLLFLLILPRRQGMVIRWGGDQKVLVVRRDEIEVPFLYPTLERTIRGCKPSDSETRRQVYQGWFHQKGLGIKGFREKELALQGDGT